MPPPSTYVDIISTPFSQTITQAQFNGGTFGGTTNACWLRYIAGGPIWFGSYTAKGGTFKPDARVFLSDGTTAIGTNHNGSQDLSWNIALPSAGTYYIRITRHGGGASDFDFTFTADTLPVLALADVPPGSLIVNDDSNGFPAVVLTNHIIIGILTAIPSGEAGAGLPTGEILWWDRFHRYASATLALFDADLNYVTSVDTVNVLGSAQPIISHDDTGFYVLDPGDGSISKITPTGVVTTPGHTTASGATAMGIKRDGTVAYWTESVNPTIQAWDLINDLALSDLYTIPGYSGTTARTPNGLPGDLLVLPDGTIVTFWIRDTDGVSILLHLSASGALLGAFEYGPPQAIDHLTYSGADGGSANVEVWFLEDEFFTIGRYATVDLGDGSFVDSLVTKMSSVGENLTNDDDSLFMPSESCTMINFIPGLPDDDEEEDVLPVGTIGPYVWVHWPRTVP